MLASFLSGSFSYTSRAGFTFIWGVSLTHPGLASFFFFLFFFFFSFFNLWSFSYTSRDGFCFYQGSSLSHHLLAYFILGVSLTHPMLPLFFCGEFSLYILCWLLFSLNLGSFSYTSRAGFNFMNGLSLRDSMLPYFL